MGFREVLHELSPFGRRMLSCDSQNSLNTRRAFVYKKCYSMINEIPSEMDTVLTLLTLFTLFIMLKAALHCFGNSVAGMPIVNEGWNGLMGF